MESIVEELKVLLRLTDDEEIPLIEHLINNALEWIEVECNLLELSIEELPRGLRAVLMDMVIFRYTVIGKEGISSENIVELSYNYGQDYPNYILRRLKRFRRLVVR